MQYITFGLTKSPSLYGNPVYIIPLRFFNFYLKAKISKQICVNILICMYVFANSFFYLVNLIINSQWYPDNKHETNEIFSAKVNVNVA